MTKITWHTIIYNAVPMVCKSDRHQNIPIKMLHGKSGNGYKIEGGA